MAKIGVELEPEQEKRFRARAHALEIKFNAALIQAVDLWMGREICRPELPADLTKEEALVCAEMVSHMRSSEEMRNFIPRAINLLRTFAKG